MFEILNEYSCLSEECMFDSLPYISNTWLMCFMQDEYKSILLILDKIIIISKIKRLHYPSSLVW